MAQNAISRKIEELVAEVFPEMFRDARARDQLRKMIARDIENAVAMSMVGPG